MSYLIVTNTIFVALKKTIIFKQTYTFAPSIKLQVTHTKDMYINTSIKLIGLK